MLKLLTLTCFLAQSFGADLPRCPDCSAIECLPKITSCPDGTNLERDMIFGCCPACVERLKPGNFPITILKISFKTVIKYLSSFKGELCRDLGDLKEIETSELPCTNHRIMEQMPHQQIPVLKLYECGLDAKCSTLTGTCELLTERQCSIAQQEYKSWYQKADCKNDGMDWEKSCLYNGIYSAAQSKTNPFNPDKRSYCFSPDGNRIFGSTTGLDDQEIITCQCSRKRWDMENSIQGER